MNKVLTLEVLNDIYNFLTLNLNDAIDNYNLNNNTRLKKVSNISYKDVKSQFPEIFFQIKSTNFDYIDITRNENMQITNECFLSYADKDNSVSFQENIERMIYIIYDLLLKLTSDNIAYILIKSVDRDEMQSKDMQIVKIFVVNFDVITLV